MLDEFCDFVQAVIQSKTSGNLSIPPECDKVESAEDLGQKCRYDYHGVKYRPHMYALYVTCGMCGRNVWHKSNINGICPKCAMTRPGFELEISFGHSKSKKYRTALRRVREIPAYDKAGERHTVRFANLSEYSECRDAVDRLILVVSGWVSFKATLNGQTITAYHIICIRGEIDRMRDLRKAVDITFVGTTPVYTFDPPVNINKILAVDYSHPAQAIKLEAKEVFCEDE